MNPKPYLAAALLAAALPLHGRGLSAAVLSCNEYKLDHTSISGDIASAVVRSLLGVAIDTIVNYLDDPRSINFEVVLPVDSINGLVAGTDCLFVSAAALDKWSTPGRPPNVWSPVNQLATPFFAKLSFSTVARPPANAPLRPIVRAWKYAEFLEPSCPVFRNCSRRDVAMQLDFLAPAAKFADSSIAAQPFAFAVVGATAADVQAAMDTTGQGTVLPWFLLGELKGPVNIRFTLVETSQPNAFTKALGAALAAQKSAILDSVDNKLKGIADQIAVQAAQADVAAAAKAFDAYKTAFDTASITLAAYNAANPQQQTVLLPQYRVQRQAALLADKLVFAAFSLAKLTWTPGALGQLPEL